MILCHGEMLIDFIPTEARDGSLAYRPAVGGSPGNVALTIARLDVPAGFVGGLSTDFFGEQIAATLAANGVSMDYVVAARPADHARLRRSQRRGAALRLLRQRGGGAELAAGGHEADRAGGEGAAFRFAVADPAAGGECLRRADAAEGGAADHQLRPEHPRRPGGGRGGLPRAARRVLRASRTSSSCAAPTSNGSRPARTSRSSRRDWLEAEARVVLFTRGGEGATIYTRPATVTRPAIKVKVADTVGAGDSAMGGLLAALADREALEPRTAGALTRSRARRNPRLRARRRGHHLQPRRRRSAEARGAEPCRVERLRRCLGRRTSFIASPRRSHDRVRPACRRLRGLRGQAPACGLLPSDSVDRCTARRPYTNWISPLTAHAGIQASGHASDRARGAAVALVAGAARLRASTSPSTAARRWRSVTSAIGIEKSGFWWAIGTDQTLHQLTELRLRARHRDALNLSQLARGGRSCANSTNMIVELDYGRD